MKKNQFSIYIILLFSSFPALAGTITEDFTTLDYVDLQTSTAVWNIVDQSARARAYANAAVESTRPIDFGDGSDGAVNSSSGYDFNTDTHPDGYNFQSLNITAGAITVTGSNPLIIRSLSTINITPAFRVNGSNGSNGSATGAAITGPVAKTCLANGGAGGAATLTTASNGGDGVQSGGTTEALTKGLGVAGGSAFDPTVDAGSSTTGPLDNNFDTTPTASFICGTSGAGGGGYQDVSTAFASGGAGGAGGGVVKLVSVGNLTLGAAIEARGGNGGNGVTTGAGCSGNGSGGNGGVVFLQTLATLTTTIDPNVSGGTSGASTCSAGSGPSFFGGMTRGDSAPASRPAWAIAAGSYNTDVVPASLTSFVQSKSYDLGTLNAGFSTPTLTTVPGAGTVTVTYSGSADGTTFSAFTADISTLSNQGYRFLKFRVTFTNPGVAGAAPKITQVTIPYSELGLATLEIKLLPGCATIQKIGKVNPAKNIAGALATLFMISLWYLGLKLSRKLRTGSQGSTH